MKLAAVVEYDGARFHGWQRQSGARSVQQTLEHALSGVADHPLAVVAAGRTDAGVHATAQVVHFQTHARRVARAWLLGTNSRLPADVALRWCEPVADDFHARFSALARSYRYVILNRHLRSALWRRRCAWVCQPLDATAMHEAAQVLVGEHDFSAFRAAGCQSRGPVREVLRLEVQRHHDFVAVDVTANAFLHHMVRIIVGTLCRVGRGEAAPDWVAAVLAAGDRRASGATAPAHGLYLTAVHYPGRYRLPTPISGDGASVFPGVSEPFLLI